MSSEATAWVMRVAARKIPAHLLSTVLAIAECASEYGRNAGITYEDFHRESSRPRAAGAKPHVCVWGLCEDGLATRTGCSVRQAKRRVVDLERLGIIRRSDPELAATCRRRYHHRGRPTVLWDIPGVVEDRDGRSSGVVRRHDM